MALFLASTVLVQAQSDATAYAAASKTEIKPKKFTEPVYPGGEQALVLFLQENIEYPESAQLDGSEGDLTAQLVICPEGKVKDVKIVHGVSQDIDDHVVATLKKTSGWIPAQYLGDNILAPINVKLKFILE